MIEVVGVSFKNSKKIYYFSPGKYVIKKGINVIVKTERGLQFGTVVIPNTKISSKKISYALNEIIRISSKKDYNIYLSNINYEKNALNKCKELVENENLNMVVLDASCNFDRTQLIFTFLSENRVDFRKLAKDLASIYKTRIELRQVGVRDKAKEVGGCGLCGRSLCCNKFLTDLDSVSINMAKNQNLSLNPNKINGVCGRLLCCLKYEDDCYKEYSKKLPKIGKIVETAKGKGKVISVDILNQKYRVDIKDIGIIEVDNNESSK